MDDKKIGMASRLKISGALQGELARRLLKNYFESKGFEDFDERVYPPIIFDMPFRIPEIFKSVEVVPYVERMDPMTNIVTVGWNVFVLGTNRIDLGLSSHKNLADFHRSVQGHIDSELNNEMRKSVNDIINFIVNILKQHKNSVERIPFGTQIPGFSQFMPPFNKKKPLVGPTASGSLYEKNKFM